MIGKSPVFQIVNVLPHSQAWRTDRLQPHGPYYFLQDTRTTRTRVAAPGDHHSSCNGIVHRKGDISVITYMLYNANQDGMFTINKIEM